MRKLKMYFRLAVACAWIGSIALFSIQFVNMIQNEKANQVLSYFVAGVFWLSLIAGQVMFWKANAERSQIEKNHTKEIKYQKKTIGLISFCRSPRGKIADIFLAASVIALLAIIILHKSTGWIILLVLAILFLSLQLHCFYNGRNYSFLSIYDKINKERKSDE